MGGPAEPSYPEADAAISGADRYQTAALVAEVFFGFGGEGPAVAGLATGTNFPDALSGGAVMALIGGPMLLTTPTTLNAHPGAFLTDNRGTIDDAFIFGAGGAVSYVVDGQVAAAIADWVLPPVRKRGRPCTPPRQPSPVGRVLAASGAGTVASAGTGRRWRHLGCRESGRGAALLPGPETGAALADVEPLLRHMLRISNCRPRQEMQLCSTELSNYLASMEATIFR